MTVSEFTFKLLLLFLPGYFSFLIIDKLTLHKDYKLHDIILNSLIYALFSYACYYFLTLLPCISLKFSFIDSLTDKTKILNFKEIIIVSIISIPIGLLLSYITNHKWIIRISNKFDITNKYGDLNVWSYILNSPDVPQWVVIRDIENNLMYEGWIEIFSDTVEPGEVFLRDVKVYENSTANLLYELPGQYIPKIKDNFVVDFPQLPYTDYIKLKEDNNE